MLFSPFLESYCLLVDLYLDLFCCFLLVSVWLCDVRILQSIWKDLKTTQRDAIRKDPDTGQLATTSQTWYHLQQKQGWGNALLYNMLSFHINHLSDCERDYSWRYYTQMAAKCQAEEHSAIDHVHQVWTKYFYSIPSMYA